MIELERHIEVLLLSNDCVIVPSLGAFVAHYVDARFDERDNMFLPPMRTLGFNPSLTHNDSLLVQSYVEAYDMSYPDALNRIEEETAELREHLDNEGTYEFCNLGILSYNDEGHLVFEPSESGILTPYLYGLGGVEISPLAESERRGEKAQKSASSNTLIDGSQTSGLEETTAKVDTDENDSSAVAAAMPVATSRTDENTTGHDGINLNAGLDDEEGDALHIPMKIVHYAAAAVIAFMLFALTIPSIDNSEVGNAEVSSIQNGALFKLWRNGQKSGSLNGSMNGSLDEGALAQNGEDVADAAGKAEMVENEADAKEETVIAEVEAAEKIESAKAAEAEAARKAEALKNAEKAEAAKKAEALKAAEAAKKAEAQKSTKSYYTIVLASMVTNRNGQEFADKLRSNGVGDARLNVHGGVTRVVCGRYASQEEAYKAVRNYRQSKGSDFAEAWVYKTND